MIEIGIVGAKNSGKTTLIEALIPRFIERGLTVATIKHTGHSHSFDQSGKDSHRHRQAGASLTLALSKSEMAFYADAAEENAAIVREIISRRFDLCLVEGNKQAERPKVLLTRKLESLKHEVPAGIAVSYGPVEYKSDIFHIALDDTGGLVDFLMSRFLTKNATG